MHLIDQEILRECVLFYRNSISGSEYCCRFASMGNPTRTLPVNVSIFCFQFLGKLLAIDYKRSPILSG